MGRIARGLGGIVISGFGLFLAIGPTYYEDLMKARFLYPVLFVAAIPVFVLGILEIKDAIRGE